LEGKPIGSNQKKNNLKESSWFGELKCELGSKVVHFFVILLFLIVFFTLVAQIMQEWKMHL
jgi:hypothetical protein